MFGIISTHKLLVGTGLPFSEVLPSDEQKQEEGQHEELPVPDHHKENLGRHGMTA